MKIQQPTEVIDIAPFPKEYEVYPEGARVKSAFILPDREGELYHFCKPSWMYLFKTSRDIYPEQFWIEIFAYQFGCLIGVTVPPAFVAFDSKNQVYGALIEWFYDEKTELYFRGGSIMQAIIHDFDHKRGRKHNLRSILHFFDMFGKEKKHLQFLDMFGKEQKDWIMEWAKIFVFDALIGNTDRHQENWGIVFKRDIKEQPRLSPAFDNGTSMGHEIREAKFNGYNIERHINKGKPHLKWDLDQVYNERENFEGFMLRFVREYPYCKEAIVQCLQFKKNDIVEIFNRFSKFDIDPRITDKRAEFMLKLLLTRQERLLQILRN